MLHNPTSRIADFLIQHPPYADLPYPVLEALATRMQMRTLVPGEFLFQEGDPPGEEVFILQNGQLKLFQDQTGRSSLMDVCETGDTVGVRSVLTGKAYVLGAQSVGESQVYVLPKVDFLPLLESHPPFGLFFATGYAAGMLIAREAGTDLTQTQASLMGPPKRAPLWQALDLVPIPTDHPVPTCQVGQTMQEAAQRMAQTSESAVVVVNAAQQALGILTNNDLTRQIATGRYPLQTAVEDLMSQPVQTVSPEATQAEVLLRMMQHNIRHLVITENGKVDGIVKALLTERDLLRAQGHHPAAFVKQISRATAVRQLAEIADQAARLIHHYLKQELSMGFVNGVMTGINDALIARAIDLSILRLGPAPLPFCWLSLGSEGRSEQLLRTDQDNALLYTDPPAEDAESVRAYFLQLGQSVVETLVACGFALCPGEIMASNPKWCQPLAGWKTHFHHWTQAPTPEALLNASIFFDFRATYGAGSLAQELHSFLIHSIAQNGQFLPMLAQNALRNSPPLSFFGRFLVERGGEHKDELDLKARAMMPLVDAARVLSLAYLDPGERTTNTVGRYQDLGEREPQNTRLFEEAAMAYELLSRYRALHGFETNSSGRYLPPAQLNAIERKTLKYVFQTIAQLQSLLKTRFSLQFLG